MGTKERTVAAVMATTVSATEKVIRLTTVRAQSAFRHFGRHHDSELPVCWAEYYINRDFAGIGRLIHHQIGPIVPLIESLFGERIEEVSQEIAGTLISAQLADRLKVKVNSAALEVRRRFTLADGKIVQVTTSVYPASRYRHSMTIRRTQS